jgi:hypothetical protein
MGSSAQKSHRFIQPPTYGSQASSEEFEHGKGKWVSEKGQTGTLPSCTTLTDSGMMEQTESYSLSFTGTI